MQIHGLSAEQSLASLKTTAAGLTAAEALRRLAEFGPNHVEEVGREPLLLSFAREFTHFFAVTRWVAAALAFLADYFDPGQSMARLGLAIVGVILVNGIFSFWQELRHRHLADRRWIGVCRSGPVVEDWIRAERRQFRRLGTGGRFVVKGSWLLVTGYWREIFRRAY